MPLVRIEGVADRDAAARLTGTRLYVERSALPPPGEEEYYLADLVGCRAVDEAGVALGTVAAVHDHGAGAFLEIARPGRGALLVPFTRASVPGVDLAARRLTVSPPVEEVVPPSPDAVAGESVAGTAEGAAA
jgi:16S rRNA processing protein RimM